MGTSLAVIFAFICINQLEQLTIETLKDNGMLLSLLQLTVVRNVQ